MIKCTNMWLSELFHSLRNHPSMLLVNCTLHNIYTVLNNIYFSTKYVVHCFFTKTNLISCFNMMSSVVYSRVLSMVQYISQCTVILNACF